MHLQAKNILKNTLVNGGKTVFLLSLEVLIK